MTDELCNHNVRMALTVAPTTVYLHYGCGHAALVSLPGIAGESRRDRGRRVAQEKHNARAQACDFCPPLEAAPARSVPEPLRAVPTDTAAAPSQPEAPEQRENSEDEHLTTSETPTIIETSATRSRSPLRKLSDEQELEVARLYRDTETSVPEIARQFGIGESSVYRVSQKHGASTRTAAAGGQRANGRRAASAPVTGSSPSVSAGSSTLAPRGRRAGPTRRSTVGQPATRRRTSQARAASLSRTASAPASSRTTSGAESGSAARRYRVAYTASVVVEVGSVKLAIERAEAQGAIDIISVERAD